MKPSIDPLEALSLLSLAKRVPEHRLFVDFDEEADVLYVSFSDPPEMPENSVEDDSGVVTRYGPDGRVVGYTYLNASQLLASLRAA